MSKKRVRITSPKGVAKYPHLNRPDTRFKDVGEYVVTLLFDPNEIPEFLAQLDQIVDEAVEEQKQILKDKKQAAKAKQVQRKPAYKMELDQEGEETGKIEVRFKTKAFITLDNGETITLEPQIFDAQGAPVDKKKVLIYGGSVLKVNFSPRSYYMASTRMAGVTLDLNAVQILQLVTRGGDAGYYGFESEEGFTDSSIEDEFSAIDSITEEDF